MSITTGNVSLDESLVRELARREIIVARRGAGIRVSPHCYNTPDHIDRLLGALSELVAGRGEN